MTMPNRVLKLALFFSLTLILRSSKTIHLDIKLTDLSSTFGDPEAVEFYKILGFLPYLLQMTQFLPVFISC